MQRSRHGTVLVLVLGLVAILLGLIISVTMRVGNSLRNGATLQQDAQAVILMHAARMIIAAHDGVLGAPLTAGDLSPGDVPGTILGDRLGWVHIKPDPAPTAFEVVAAGGGSGSGQAKVTVNAGPGLSNAFEVRYAYAMTYDPALRSFAITTRPVADNTTYPW